MQTIIKTAPASNFTIIANDLINSDMPPIPYRVLSYLLSKPVNWQLKTHDLRKQLGLSAYAVKKALRWLCSAGFAAYVRLRTGHTIWRIFDKPQVTPQEKAAYSPVFTPQVEIPQMENQPVLVRTETELKKETTTGPIPEIKQKAVVVFCEEEKADLQYPPKLTPTQLKDAKHIIKKAPAHLRQDVLSVLAYYMTAGTVKSPCAYLNVLATTAARNGTFEPVGTAAAIKQVGKPLITEWKGYGPITPSKPEVAKGHLGKVRAALRGVAI